MTSIFLAVTVLLVIVIGVVALTPILHLSAHRAKSDSGSASLSSIVPRNSLHRVSDGSSSLAGGSSSTRTDEHHEKATAVHDAAAPDEEEEEEDQKESHKSLLLFPRVFDYVDVTERMTIDDEKGGAARTIGPCKLISDVHPRAFTCEELVTEAEAHELIEIGSPLLQKSGVAVKHGVKNARTSLGARLPSSATLVKKVNRRILSLLNNTMSGSMAERLYLLRYKNGTHYVLHPDDFGGRTSSFFVSQKRKRYKSYLKSKRATESEKTAQADGKFVPFINDGHHYTVLDRAVTVLLYLRSLPGDGGGETALAGLDPQGNRIPKSAQKKVIKMKDLCATSENQAYYHVKPRIGRVLVFYSLLRNGVSDNAIHAGCDVRGDIDKWTITKWMQVGI